MSYDRYDELMREARRLRRLAYAMFVIAGLLVINALYWLLH